MPRYSGPSVDGSNTLPRLPQVPPTYATTPRRLRHTIALRVFGQVGEGHAAASKFDRFKIIVRMCSLDGGIKSPFLRKMVDWFNDEYRSLKYSQSGLTCSLASPTPLSTLFAGKPMLWRFFGV